MYFPISPSHLHTRLLMTEWNRVYSFPLLSISLLLPTAHAAATNSRLELSPIPVPTTPFDLCHGAVHMTTALFTPSNISSSAYFVCLFKCLEAHLKDCNRIEPADMRAIQCASAPQGYYVLMTSNPDHLIFLTIPSVCLVFIAYLYLPRFK